MDFQKATEIFDLYIDWKRRLDREMPYLVSRLKEEGSLKVADVACGCGKHALSLVKAGFKVTALDADPGLLKKAEILAHEEGLVLHIKKALFDDLPLDMASTFDASVCLGNSISLVGPGEALRKALEGISRLLKPRGILMLHTLNYPMLAQRGSDPWGPVRLLEDGSILLKAFFPRDPGPWDVLLVHLKKREGGWTCHPVRFSIYPHSVSEMEEAAQRAGLSLRALNGGFGMVSRDDPSSADLLYEWVKNF